MNKVLILDGSSLDCAHIWSKSGTASSNPSFFGGKRLILLHTCATDFELQFSITTMDYEGHCQVLAPVQIWY